MSGRKSGEVLNLLSNAADLRRKTLANIENNIKNMVETSKVTKEKLAKLKSDVKIAKLQISKEEGRKYAKEISELEAKMQGLKKWLESPEKSSMNELVKKYQEILGIYKAIDSKADELRRQVANTPHYCNLEYDEAQRLIERTKSNNNELFQLKDKMEKENNDLQIRFEVGNKNVALNEELKVQCHDMEERVKADNNTVLIEKEFGRINTQWGKKFAKDDFEKLEVEVKNLGNISVDELNRNTASLLERISTLRNTVSERKEEFDMKKARALREQEELNKKVGSLSYEDIYTNITTNTTDNYIGIFEFEKQYCDTSSEKEFGEICKKISKDIESENFDGALEALEKGRNLLNRVEKVVTDKYNNKLSEFNYVSKIVDTMYDMQYDVDVNFIDGDIANGVTIEATAGDEVITFDRIQVDDNGNPVIELDHEEDVKGTCGRSIEKVVNSMRENGIFITDMKKGSNSVIYKEKKAQGTTINKKEKAKM